MIKRGPQGETAYINQFFTMRNREVGTKHVFAGGTRLVSKLVKAPNVVDLDGDGIPDDIPKVLLGSVKGLPKLFPRLGQQERLANVYGQDSALSEASTRCITSGMVNITWEAHQILSRDWAKGIIEMKWCKCWVKKIQWLSLSYTEFQLVHHEAHTKETVH